MGYSEVALGLTLSIAAWTDWHERKIYNKLLAPAFIAAVILQFLQSGWQGVESSLLGTLLGFCLLFIPYFMGGMGAGDVKLLAVIGAFGGTSFVFTGFLYGAIIGGVISAVILARRKVLGATLKYFLLFFPLLRKPKALGEAMKEARQEKFPYGIAIALGTVLALFLPLGGLR